MITIDINGQYFFAQNLDIKLGTIKDYLYSDGSFSFPELSFQAEKIKKLSINDKFLLSLEDEETGEMVNFKEMNVTEKVLDQIKTKMLAYLRSIFEEHKKGCENFIKLWEIGKKFL